MVWVEGWEHRDTAPVKLALLLILGLHLALVPGGDHLDVGKHPDSLLEAVVLPGHVLCAADGDDRLRDGQH